MKINVVPSIEGRAVVPYFVKAKIERGEILPVMGLSGVGKTSLLSSLINDQTFSVFQSNDQLFPWFTNKKNLELVCKEDWQDIANKWNVFDLMEKSPAKCSGGQRQRLTLIRALCSGKSFLLCDEPLSGVDNFTKIEILKDFKETISKLKKTALWVTHDPLESLALNNRVLIMKPNSYEITNIENLNELYEKVI